MQTLSGRLDRVRCEVGPRGILIAVDPDRSAPATVGYGIARASRARAQLTVMCVWRPSRLLPLAAVSEVDPQALLADHERAAMAWFRARVAEVPGDICLRTLFLRGRLRDHLARQLVQRDYDEVIVDRLSERDLARMRGIAPGVAIRHPA